MTEFALRPSGPFSWELAGDFLGNFPATAHHGAGPVVRMAFPLDRTFEPVAVALRWEDGELRGEVAGSDDLEAVAAQVARIFSLDFDGAGYPGVARRDPVIGRLMEMRPGQRPVLFTSPYECAAWAVISQRITRRQAVKIKDWLIANHGAVVEIAGGTARSFPGPGRLLAAETVPSLPPEKVARLHGVAQAALDGRLDAVRLREMGEAAATAELRRIPGIGEFWSSGIYLRAVGTADAFPREPLTIAALAAAFGLGRLPTDDEVSAITSVWRPYRMWVCVLLRILAGRGLIDGLDDRGRLRA